MEDKTLFECVKDMTFEQFNVWIADIATGGKSSPEEILKWKSFLNGKVNS